MPNLKVEDSYLKKTLLNCKHAIYVVAFFSFFINLLVLTVPLYMLQIYDRVLASHSYDTLIYLTLIAAIALLVYGLLDMVRAKVLVQMSQWLDTVLSPEALRRAPDDVLQGSRYGSQALRDITNIRQFVGGSGIISFFDAPWVPIYLVVIYLLHPILGLVATFGAILLFALAILNERATGTMLSEANEKSIISTTFVENSLRNSEAIQAMGMMPNIIQEWEKQNADVIKLQVEASDRAGRILAISKFARLFLQVLILGVGAALVIVNRMTAGQMIAASILLTRALAPVEQAISVWKMMLSARSAYNRLSEHFTRDIRLTSEIHLPTPRGQVTAENVVYRVPQQKLPVIAGVSFTIQPGEMVAIIGPSGAGKSTLARLLVGVNCPFSGSVRMDGADVYAWDRRTFGQYIGYHPQDLELFPGTVKANIARLGEVNDEAVITAAKLAGIHDMILHLPNGYDTQVMRGGYTLSGGQLQRIALARAYYQNPKLIVLDEPNSNLDSDGEVALQNALQTFKKQGATQIIIAHRPSIIRQVDIIIILVAGKIQMMGPREGVLAKLQSQQQSNMAGNPQQPPNPPPNPPSHN